MSLDSLDNKKERILVKNNAQTIFDHLEELEGLSNNEKRWFWELLQNAIDAVEDNEYVTVKVILNPGKLEFRHNGTSFIEDDVLHIIYHGSTKKELEGKTGRFGTGFMTTHLLSKRVDITGKANEKYFKFLLNREAVDVKEQENNLDKSYDSFKESLNANYSLEDDFETGFIYHLDEKGEQIAEKGIAALNQVLPYVLAFNSKLKEVIVIDKGGKTVYKRTKDIISEKDKSIIEHTIKIDSQNRSYEFKIVVKQCDESSISLCLINKDGTYFLQKLDQNFPRLLFNFPLFGTETMGLPIIINSDKFFPLRERNGIFLNEGDNEKNLFNKALIENSLKNLPGLIAEIGSYQVKNTFELLNYQEPQQSNWLDKNWLNTCLDESFNQLLNIPLVKPSIILEKKLLSINESIIPIKENETSSDFEDLFYQLIPHLVPCKDELTAWKEITENVAKIKGLNICDLQFTGDIETICQKVASFNNMTNLVEDFKSRHIEHVTSKTYDFLNKLISFCESEHSEMFQKYAFVPDQNGRLREIKPGEIFRDDIEDVSLKSLATKFDIPINEILIDNSINITQKVISLKTKKDLLSDINYKRSQIKDEDLKYDIKRTAFVHNLKWLLDNNESDLLREIPVIVLQKAKNGEISYLKKNLKEENNRLLAPPVFWNNTFPTYENLINSKYLLINEYAEVLNEIDVNKLDEDGFLLSSPLIRKIKIPTKFELEKMVKTENDLQRSLNQDSEVDLQAFSYSDIAYFTMSEGHILDRVRGSFTAAKQLIMFLLEDCVKADENFDEIKEVLNSKGESISLQTSVWLGRLKKVQWVPVKNESGENNAKPIGEHPSTSNILPLLDDELKQKIKSESSFRMFNQLGISVADLYRGSLKNETEKLSWDMAFFKLMISGISADLAMKMLSDPQLQEKYEEQERNKERIRRNQNIGYMFEQVFRELFEQPEFKEKGLRIDRKPFGSDFKIEIKDVNRSIVDSDVLDENQNEQLFQIGSFLVELKAVGKKYASMTSLQAETASIQEGFTLVVLPISDFEINVENVKKYARFVTNIGEQIKPKVEKVKNIYSLKDSATIMDSSIEIQMEGELLKYNVKESVWVSGKSFQEFIIDLKKTV